MNKLFISKRMGTFISTREHRKFVEFADTVLNYKYIGLCFGPAGVGKTISAKKYARWDIAGKLLTEWGPREESDAKIYSAIARSRSIFYTPTVGITLTELRQNIPMLINRANICIEECARLKDEAAKNIVDRVSLIIIDEAERLSTNTLEYLRDFYDRDGICLILIGMPGIDKKLARYPQLYSRVGFAHHYKPLKEEEMTFVLNRRWQQLGIDFNDTDFTDTQALAEIVRITGGNFRLVHRLFVQIERILRINGLNSITADVVEAARSVLVIGAT